MHNLNTSCKTPCGLWTTCISSDNTAGTQKSGNKKGKNAPFKNIREASLKWHWGMSPCQLHRQRTRTDSLSYHQKCSPSIKWCMRLVVNTQKTNLSTLAIFSVPRWHSVHSQYCSPSTANSLSTELIIPKQNLHSFMGNSLVPSPSCWPLSVSVSWLL